MTERESSLSFARRLRANSTDAERKLWSILRAHRLEGYKFKRQQPIDGYTVDFVCFEARLVIEADGGQHSDSRSDVVRDAHRRRAGFEVLRFWNTDILMYIEGVWERIAEVLRDRR
jgi:very-short-patch-repair endonuclease